MPGPTLLFEALENLLAVTLAALDTIPTFDASLDGAPGCAYIAPGPPPWDTYPCVIAYTSGPAVADTFPLQPSLSPGHRTTRHGEVNLVAMSVVVLRCAWEPSDEAPDTIDGDAITRSARQSSADLWAALSGIRQAKREERLFAPEDREFFIDPTVAVNQQGGAVGWQVNLRTQLDGYSI